jgi:hypothetical protein
VAVHSDGAFPYRRSYVVVVRDRVAHQQPADAADIMVKHLRPDKTLPIIFTMEDKRAQKKVAQKQWDQAKAQLEKYFTIECQSETSQGATRKLHGAVAIGMRVQFWDYGTAGSRGEQQMIPGGVYHVVQHKERIQEKLREIKDQEEQIVQSLLPLYTVD